MIMSDMRKGREANSFFEVLWETKYGWKIRSYIYVYLVFGGSVLLLLCVLSELYTASVR